MIIKRSNGRHTPVRIHLCIEEKKRRVFKNKENQPTKLFFSGVSQKAPLVNVVKLGSYRPNFIEVARLKNLYGWKEKEEDELGHP